MENSPIMLRGPADWDDWFEMIQRTAHVEGVPEYFNSYLTEATRSEPHLHPLPQPEAYNPSAKAVAQLSIDEKQKFLDDTAITSARNVPIRDEITGIRNVNRTILATISPHVTASYLRGHFDLTGHEILGKLRDHLAPDKRLRAALLRDEYNGIKTMTPSVDAQEWINRYQQVVYKCKAHGLVEMDGSQHLFEFFDAMTSVDKDLAQKWRLEVLESNLKGAIPKAVDVYLNELRIALLERKYPVDIRS